MIQYVACVHGQHQLKWIARLLIRRFPENERPADAHIHPHQAGAFTVVARNDRGPWRWFNVETSSWCKRRTIRIEFVTVGIQAGSDVERPAGSQRNKRAETQAPLRRPRSVQLQTSTAMHTRTRDL